MSEVKKELANCDVVPLVTQKILHTRRSHHSASKHEYFEVCHCYEANHSGSVSASI